MQIESYSAIFGHHLCGLTIYFDIKFRISTKEEHYHTNDLVGQNTAVTKQFKKDSYELLKKSNVVKL